MGCGSLLGCLRCGSNQSDCWWAGEVGHGRRSVFHPNVLWDIGRSRVGVGHRRGWSSRVGIILVHCDWEGDEIGVGRSPSCGWPCMCTLDSSVVRDKSGALIDADATEEQLKCPSNPAHLTFHLIYTTACPSCLFGHLVEGGHLRFEDSNPLVLPQLLVHNF